MQIGTLRLNASTGMERSRRLALIVLLSCLLLCACRPAYAEPPADDEDTPTPPALGAALPTPPPPVRIGMVNTLFRDVPQPLMMAMMQPFGALMKALTGVSGELVAGGDAMHLGKQIADGRVQLGVFHGIEYAWVRLKYPELQPLMIAVNQERHLRCHLIVRDDNEAKTLADLKGNTLALPRGTREHARLFLERNCRLCGQNLKTLFPKVTTPPTIEDALDDVVDDVVQATIVDAVALDCYKRRKPGRCAKLKTLILSELFPAGVVVYHPGTLDAATLQRFREGMVNANKEVMGRQMLTLWKLTGFEPVPEDYDAVLTNIIKPYPPPAGTASK